MSDSVGVTRSAPRVAPDWRATVGRIWLTFCAALFLFISVRGVRLGYGSHGDSRAILESSVPAILDGRYHRSRSYGNPLYEAITAGLYAVGGINLVNFYSVVLSVLSIAIFAWLLSAQQSPLTWALPGFMLNALFATQATSPTEFAQSTFFFVASVALIRSWLDGGQRSRLILYGMATCALVLTRPDFAVATFALAGAVMWELRSRSTDSRWFSPPQAAFAGCTVAAVGVGASVIWALNSLEKGQSLQEMITGNAPSLFRRIAVGSFGLLTVFGAAGLIAIATGVFLILRRRTTGTAPLAGSSPLSGYTFSEKLLLLSLPILVARYITQPDKLSYLLPLIPVVLLGLSVSRQPKVIPAVLALSLMLTSFISLSFLRRDAGTDHLRISPSVSKGAVQQDWDARESVRNATDPDFLAKLSGTVFPDEKVTPSLSFPLWSNGLISSNGYLLISDVQSYKLNNSRIRNGGPADPMAIEGYRGVLICNKEIAPTVQGWRVSQPQVDYLSIDELSAGHFSCYPLRAGSPATAG